MKFSTIVSLGLTAITALAAPTPSMISPKRSIEKRAASLEDVATVGYATTNGGTTGGKGGKTVKVASLSELTAAVKGDDAAIVLITGPIKGSGDNVKVGSNKSIIGQNSKVILENFTITVKGVSNVILRNFAMQKVVGGDAVAIQKVRFQRLNHLFTITNSLPSPRTSGLTTSTSPPTVTTTRTTTTDSSTSLTPLTSSPSPTPSSTTTGRPL
jgi:pectate lyase